MTNRLVVTAAALSLVLLAPLVANAHQAPRTTCSDGWESPSTGSGTCSWHGGIAGGGSGGGIYIPPISGGSGGDYSLPPAGSGSSVSAGSRWTGRYFSSPSGNIQCRYEPGRQRLGCSSLSAGQTAWVSRRFTSWVTYGVISTRATSIPYGDYWAMGGFECYSLTTGMACFPPTGTDSFLVNKSGAWTYE